MGLDARVYRTLLQILIILIYTSHPRNRLGETMYVCMCNCVTDRQLMEAAAEFASGSGERNGALFAVQVADRLGAGLGCGSCREFALDLVERAATQQGSVVLSDSTSPHAIDSPAIRNHELPYRPAFAREVGAAALRRE